MSPSSVTVRVPATSANLGPGFDALGVALDWTAEVTISVTDTPEEPSADPIERMAAAAAFILLDEAGERPAGVHAEYRGDLPVGRGLGMSAAARAAGIVAANAMLGDRITPEGLIPLAVRLEGHGDNIIPALFGGLQVVVHDEDATVHVPIAPPTDLRLALLIPEFGMPTDESRQRLPQQLGRGEAVHNLGRAALLIAALTQGRYDVLRTAVEDVIHQPARSTLFPAMYAIFEAAYAAGAYGAYLSGGGSTIAAFAAPDRAEDVAGSMREAAAVRSVEATSKVVTMSAVGTTVVRR